MQGDLSQCAGSLRGSPTDHPAMMWPLRSLTIRWAWHSSCCSAQCQWWVCSSGRHAWVSSERAQISYPCSCGAWQVLRPTADFADGTCTSCWSLCSFCFQYASQAVVSNGSSSSGHITHPIHGPAVAADLHLPASGCRAQNYSPIYGRVCISRKWSADQTLEGHL